MGKNRKNQKKVTTEAPIMYHEEEEEPFLRGLQRKVRNLTKKLGTIKDLENKSKGDLDANQLEKIAQK